MTVGKQKFLLEEEEDEDQLDSITVNKEFAKRFEHNKRREDLHRLQELQKKGIVGGDDSDESTEEEEDEDGLLPNRVDVQIFDTLAKIRKKDPNIYAQDAKFYDDEEESEGERPTQTDKKKKPMYLKDVIARQLLEDGAGVEDEKQPPKRVPLTYAQEQEELRKLFFLSVEEAESGGDNGGGLLRLKKKTPEELEKDRKDTEEAVAEAEQRAKDLDISRRLEEYFGQETELDANEKFLKSYLLNKGWIDTESQKFSSFGGVEVSEDEEELDKQDKFEADYNFRFQEEAGSQIQGHSRFVESSVRKKADTRKRQRESKQERQAEEERRRQEELKWLKNVKKGELMERLDKIRYIAGADEDALAALGVDDLEEDFDPEQYDKKMAEAFGDGYYGAKDVNEMFNDEDADDIAHFEKPDFEADDEMLQLPKGWDAGPKVGFEALRAEQKRSGVQESSSEVHTLVDIGAAPDGKHKGKISLKDKVAFEKKLEEYYKLDYEDMVGDLPTRFKYKKIKPNTFGIRTDDVLSMDDKELNQLVSLKKLAPYRTEEWQVPRHVRHRISKRERKNHAFDVVPRYTSTTKKLKKENDSKEKNLQVTEAETAGEQHSQSMNGGAVEAGRRPKKRKRKQKGPDLPMSRLLAYGKVQAPPKKRKN